MKLLLSSLGATLAVNGFILAGSAQAASEPTFQTACEISLVGAGVQPFSEVKVSPAGPAASGPRVSFDLGDSVLTSYVQSALPDGATDFEPQLSVSLYKKTEGPIIGQINYSGLTGLKNMSVGQAATASSHSFIGIAYNGQRFSRIDYSCSIKRIN